MFHMAVENSISSSDGETYKLHKETLTRLLRNLSENCSPGDKTVASSQLGLEHPVATRPEMVRYNKTIQHIYGIDSPSPC